MSHYKINYKIALLTFLSLRAVRTLSRTLSPEFNKSLNKIWRSATEVSGANSNSRLSCQEDSGTDESPSAKMADSSIGLVDDEKSGTEEGFFSVDFVDNLRALVVDLQ